MRGTLVTEESSSIESISTEILDVPAGSAEGSPARRGTPAAEKSWRRRLRKQHLLLCERKIARTTSFSCACAAQKQTPSLALASLARHANNLFLLRSLRPLSLPPPSSLLTHHAATAVLVL